jgi:hypothetical protein
MLRMLVLLGTEDSSPGLPAKQPLWRSAVGDTRRGTEYEASRCAAALATTLRPAITLRPAPATDRVVKHQELSPTKERGYHPERRNGLVEAVLAPLTNKSRSRRILVTPNRVLVTSKLLGGPKVATPRLFTSPSTALQAWPASTGWPRLAALDGARLTRASLTLLLCKC